MPVTRAEESAYANRHHQTPLEHPCPAVAGGGGGVECDSLEITGACKKRQEEVGLGQRRRLCPHASPSAEVPSRATPLRPGPTRGRLTLS
jgi:hypothetical protein